MALIQAIPIRKGEERFSVTATDSKEQLAWHVFSDVSETARSVCNGIAALSLPVWGSVSGSLVATEVYVDCLDVVNCTPTGAAAHFLWKYAVTYGPPAFQNVDPEDDDPEIEWGGSNDDVYDVKDATGNAIVNSAKDLYENIPPRKRRGGEVSVSFNLNDNPSALCTNLSNTANNGTWNGVGEANGLIGVVKSRFTKQMRNGVEKQFWKTTVPMKFARDGHRFKPIDCGYRKYVSGEQVIICGADNQPVAQPALLNGTGGVLAPGGTPVIYSNTTPTTKGYDLYELADWSTYPIPNPFA